MREQLRLPRRQMLRARQQIISVRRGPSKIGDYPATVSGVEQQCAHRATRIAKCSDGRGAGIGSADRRGGYRGHSVFASTAARHEHADARRRGWVLQDDRDQCSGDHVQVRRTGQKTLVDIRNDRGCHRHGVRYHVRGVLQLLRDAQNAATTTYRHGRGLRQNSR